MQPLSPFFALIIFAIAFATAYLLNLRFKIKFTSARFKTIDGLRGFLALGVFMHHAAIWHQYLRTGIWEAPRSNFYNFLGQGCVLLFFMITSFLFVTKLLDAKEKGIDWRKFFLGRIRRIFPMYYFSLMLILVMIMFATHWQLQTSFPKFLESVLNWVLFTINGFPDINKFELTNLTNAGVIWSLPYEWLFYFALPLIALFLVKRKPSYLILAISIGFIIAFIFVHGIKGDFGLAFIGGGIAPFILRKNSRKMSDGLAGLIIVACMAGILQFRSVNNVFCILLLTIIFTIVATGHSIFGLFKIKTLQFLGDISYSTYLLHGIVLFATFYFVKGFGSAGNLTPFEYCRLIFMLTPIVVLCSFAGFMFIERPFMRKNYQPVAEDN